ncbi:MAG: NUDIX hydrolase [Actinomycetota bacterium]
MSSIEALLNTVLVAPSRGVIERAADLARAVDGTDRNRFEPGHFTASGIVVSPDGSSLLVVHHRRLDRWLQPGGHIDPEDDSPIDAARREVWEETGISTEPVVDGLLAVDIHAIPARDPEPVHEHFDLRFALQGIDATITVADEVHDAAWVRWGDLDSFDLDESVIAAAAMLRLLKS